MFHSDAGYLSSMSSQAELVGRRDLRAAALAQMEERVLVDLVGHRVVHDVAHLEVLVLLRSQVSIQNASMRTISFCSVPIEPDTSIM
jgi:hypothetical protein